MRRGSQRYLAWSPILPVTAKHTRARRIQLGFGPVGPAQQGLRVAWVAVGVSLLASMGPIPALAVSLLAAAVLLTVHWPALAIGLPVVTAPVALINIPGAFGLQGVHIVIAVSAGAVLLAYLRGTVRSPPPVGLVWAFLFVGAILTSTLTGIAPLRGLKVASNHLLGLALCMAAATVTRQSARWFRQTLAMSVIAGAMVILPNIPAATKAGGQFSGALITDRAQGVFAQPNDFGEFALFCTGMSWALMVCRRRGATTYLGALGLVISVAGLAVSFSRGAWIGAAAMVLVACALAPALLKPVLAGVSATSAVSAIGVLLSVPPFPLLVQRLGLGDGGVVNPEDDRPIIFALAWRVFEEQPILGLGPASFPLASREPGALLVLRPYVHAHNVPLHVAAEMGLVGLATLIGVTVAGALVVVRAVVALRVEGRTSRQDRMTVAILAGTLAGVAAHGVIDVVYTNPYLIALLWLIYGLTMGAATRILDDRRRRALA